MAVKVKHIESGGASQKAGACLPSKRVPAAAGEAARPVKNTWRLELPNLIVAHIGSAHPLRSARRCSPSCRNSSRGCRRAAPPRRRRRPAAGIAPVAPRRRMRCRARRSPPAAAAAAAKEPPARRRRLPAAPAGAGGGGGDGGRPRADQHFDLQKMISTMAAVLDAACLSNN